MPFDTLRSCATGQEIDQPVQANAPRHEISDNVVSATNKCSDQPAHKRSLIRAFAILTVCKLKMRLHRIV